MIDFTLVAPSSITKVVEVDPTVAMMFNKAVPADARALTFASGILSGGVTGPNNLVRLAQGISAAPDGVEQSADVDVVPLLQPPHQPVHALMMLCHYFNRLINRYMGEQTGAALNGIHGPSPLCTREVTVSCQTAQGTNLGPA